MIETDILECLRRIEEAVSSDKYEDLGIWTVGGGNGTYTLKSPVNTEAEWAIYDISVAGACSVLISNNPASNTLSLTGSVNYGGGGGNENNALEGAFFPFSGPSSIPPTTELFWQPCGRGSSIYVLISGLAASNAAFVIIVWRRLLNRYIPTPPRRPPVTHSTRPSNRAQRVLQAESPMTAGFQEGRYAIPGGSPFKHTVTPSQTDKAAIERGIAAPLTPAQIVLAKLRGRTGQDK